MGWEGTVDKGKRGIHGGVVGGSLPAALVIYTGHWLGKLMGDLRDPGCPGVSVSHWGHVFPRGLACLWNGCSRAQGRRRRLEPSLGEGTGMKPRPASSPEPTGATEATSSTKQPSALWGPLRVSVTQTIWAWGRSSETLLNSPPLWERRKWELQKLGAGGRVGARSLVGAGSAANPPSSQKGATCHR